MDLHHWMMFIAGGLGTLFVVWIANRDTETARCKTGWFILSIYLFGIGMFGWMAATLHIPNFYEEGVNDEYWLKPLSIGMLLLFNWAFVDGLTRELSWDSSGVTVKKLFSAEKSYSWDQLESLNYNFLLQFFRIGFSDGSGFMIHEAMRGSRAFVAACLENASPKSNIWRSKHKNH